MTLLEAMARQEGFYIGGSLAQRNHNPGNIISGQFATAHGSIGAGLGYAVFPDDLTGFAAMRALLTGPAYRGLTVEAAINKWCPPQDGSELTAGNQPDVYVRNVCQWCQCQPADIIDSMLDPA